MAENKYAAIHYNEYLELDKLLDSQKTRSPMFGEEAHDEMLFIITHQAYELWFKQLIHELKKIQTYFGPTVSDVNLPRVNHYLDRCIRIVKLMVHQLEVLETMTPMDFLEFRNYLFPASGFQSYQFRITEVLLGLKNRHRITYGGHHYAAFFDEKQKAELEALENGVSILEAVEDWLERTPFITFGEFDFLAEYQNSLHRMITSEKASIESTDILNERQKAVRLSMLGDSDTFFKSIFDEKSYNEKYVNGDVRISYKAMQAALFISLYRDYPILQMPYQIIERLSELEEFLTLWRFRHTQMVKRIIGSKIGTGGSVGVNYLLETALKHTIFGDIQGITSLMVSTTDLPELPDDLKSQLQFKFESK
jgi:tryptophan 2,3-dioxygenase